MPAILCSGVWQKPDRPPRSIERLGDLRAALARPEARLLKTHVAPTQKRKGGISYEVNGRTVAPATVAQALTLGRLRPHDPDLLGDDGNSQTFVWEPCHE
jgi:hypothetical protein